MGTDGEPVLEIEIKARLPNYDEVRKRLQDMGATLLADKDQEDVYLAHPGRDFGRTDEALRLRKDGDKEVLTYKGPKLDGRSKTREEVETPVRMEDLRLILARLGFMEFIVIRKHRVEFLLHQVHVCLDQVEGLGDYIELEFEGQDVEGGLTRIESLKSELGVSGNETSSYLELILEKNKS